MVKITKKLEEGEMAKVATGRMHDGSRVVDGIDMFTALINMSGMERYTVKGWDRGITLSIMLDPAGWLGSFMIKSDELCLSLLGSRMWDVVYVGDKDSVEGFKPVDIAKSNQDDKSVKSYYEYPLAEEAGTPYSLRFMICRMAMMRVLMIEGTEVSIKPYYRAMFNDVVPPGSAIPLVSEVQNFAGLLSQFTRAMNETYNKDLNNELNFDLNGR